MADEHTPYYRALTCTNASQQRLARSVFPIPGFVWMISAAGIMCCINICLFSNGVAQTPSFMVSQRKKSQGVRSGEHGGYATCPTAEIHLRNKLNKKWNKVDVLNCYSITKLGVFITIIRVFCPKAGPSLQAEKPRLQLCRRQVFQRKLRNQGCSFTRDLTGAVAFRYFPHPTFSLASE